MSRSSYTRKTGATRSTATLPCVVVRPRAEGAPSDTGFRCGCRRGHRSALGQYSSELLLYLTGFDLTRRAARTFRIERIADLRLLEGTFTRPTDTDDDDPVNQVRGPLSAAPDRHPVSVRIRTDVAHVRTFIPEMLASVTPIPAAEDGEGWLRVFLHAERLEWVACRLAVIDRPFVIEYPQALRDNVFALAQRLITASQ